MRDEFDFGFSAVDQEELASVTNARDETDGVRQNLTDLMDRFDRYHARVSDFIDKLCANPERDTIYWPNREERARDFLRLLTAIKEGDTDEG